MSVTHPQTVYDLVTASSGTGQFGASFSQLGEDRILWWMFEQKRNGFYVDVGCHHPYRFSNTALLHIVNDWHGINVDVDERSIAAFETARPGDINLQAAIGGEAGRLELTMFQTGEINTLDPVMAANPARTHLIMNKVMVEVRPLHSILQEHVPPGQKIDLLNIDIEGLDYAALLSNDWNCFVPDVIAVEVHGFSMADPTGNPTFRFLISKGYHLLAHLVVTSIYRRNPT